MNHTRISRRVLELCVLVVFCLVLCSCPDPHSTIADLYYVSQSGNDANPGTLEKPWATFAKACEAAGPGDTVYVRGGTYRERLVLTASGTADAPVVFSAYPGESPVIDGENIEIPDRWGGLIEASAIGHIRIRGFTVRNSDGFAIFVVDGCDIVIEDNVTHTSYGSGILAWGDTDLVIRRNEVAEACTGGEGCQECISVSNSDRFEVSGNRVHHGYMEGIDAKGNCRNGTIHHNTVHDLVRLGIYIDAWDAGEHDIDVFDNVVYACSEGIRVNAENGGVAERIRVYGNTVSGCAGNGFWICVGGVADRSHTVRDIELYGNVSRGNERGFTISVPGNGVTERIRVYNNLVYGNTYNGIAVDDYSGGTAVLSAVEIVNNTVWGNGYGGDLDNPAEWAHGGIFITASNAQDVLIRNNIVSDNRNFAIAVHSGVPSDEVTADHNLVETSWTYECEIPGTDCIEGDPSFLNEHGGDFRLSAGSPAVDAGSPAGAPAADFSGTVRPCGDSVEIGAFEHVPAVGRVSFRP